MSNILTTTADWCSILGLIGVIVTLCQVFKTRKDLAAARSRGTYADMVKFVDTQAKVGVTIAPFQRMPFLPRVGERLTLPVTPDGLSYLDYRVTDIHYVCSADDKSEDAQLINVRVDVAPVKQT